MDLLQIREAEIFSTLKRLKGLSFVVVGGYAVNAYTLPRFSVDCDIVIGQRSELNKIEKTLLEMGYQRKDFLGTDSETNFARYEKTLEKSFDVSLDVLIDEMLDRQTNVSITSDWIFENSDMRVLKGKTINERLKVRIVNVDALFVMKMISCRQTDIRDLFMLSQIIVDKEWIKKEVASRYDFGNRLEKIRKTVRSKEFRNGLQGVYGFIEDKTFEKGLSSIDSLGTAPKIGPFKREEKDHFE